MVDPVILVGENYHPVITYWSFRPRHFSLGLSAGAPAIMQQPEFRVLDTHYFGVSLELAYNHRLPLVTSSFWSQWFQAGARFRYVGGASQNYGSNEVLGEAFVGVRQDIVRNLFVGARLLVSVGETAHNYGRNVAPRESVDINLGACAEIGGHLHSRYFHISPYAAYCYSGNIFESNSVGNGYSVNGFEFGLRVPLSPPVLRTEATQRETPTRQAVVQPPPETAPTCELVPAIRGDDVQIHWTTQGRLHTDETQALSLYRIENNTFYTLIPDPDTPGDYSEPLSSVPDSGATYVLYVSGPAGRNSCRAAVAHPPTPEPIQCPPPAPPPSPTSTAVRYIEAPIAFANQSSDLYETRDLNQDGHHGPRRHQGLEGVSRYMAEHPSVRLRIHGYANEVGPVELNNRLSRERVLAVVRYLTRDAEFPVSTDRLLHGPETYHGSVPPTEDGSIMRNDRRYRMVVFEVITEDLANGRTQ